MKRPKSPRRWIPTTLGILATAAAYFISTGLHGLWPFAWIAPIPVLVLAFKSSARLAAASAFVAYLLGSFNLLSYLATLAPIGVLIVALMLPALAFALAVLFARQVVQALEHWVSIFAFPAAWISYEYLLSISSPHGTFGSLAYTQTDFLPIIQIASVTGIWGITFVLTLVPAGMAVAWHFRRHKSRAVAALAIALSIGLLTLAYGGARLAEPDLHPRLRVGLATTDATIKHFRTEQAYEALPVVEAYAHRIGELAARGARVVVLPEKFVGVAPSFVGDVYRILSEAARASHVTVVAGLNRVGSSVLRNTAVVFSPDGRVLTEYDKAYLVPGYEAGYQPGTRPGLFYMPQAAAGVAVCKDMDFPDWLRRYARANAGIVFVPAWDFVRDARLHARMAVLRGVEGGFAVVRAAQEGLLTVSDHFGRILAEDTSSRASEVLLVTDVAPGPGRTIYSRSGNWFGWINLLLLVLGITTTVVHARKRKVALTDNYPASP